MASEEPPFWWKEADWRAWSLWPFSAVYGRVARARMARGRREKVAPAVLCVGNLTIGGEGKTPVAIALAREALRGKIKAGFLSRGYGGSLSAPHLVDPENDAARLVGDEPLLLARHAPTVVAADRIAGVARLVSEGCELIIMDDGFQSARVHMDYALIVIDARRGVGNGHVIPGGPLRAPLIDQMRYADAVVRMGEGEAADIVVRQAARAGRPVFTARVAPCSPQEFQGARVLAFAGIGNPEKFYATLRETGAEIAATRSFPDHHPFSAEDIADLNAEAKAGDLQLVTTEKDQVRLCHGDAAMAAFARSVRALPIRTVFENEDTPDLILRDTLGRWRERVLARPD